MKKAVQKLIDNKSLSTVIMIAIILVADMLLWTLILPHDPLQFNTRDFLQKYYDNETVTLSQWLRLFWNGNSRLLIKEFIILAVIILFFRFRFTKDENFRLSRHTAVIAMLCLVLSAIGSAYLMRYELLHDGLSWQARIMVILELVFVVALFEELIYRGFITTALFRLKSSGLRTSTAIAISAVIFGFVHIQGGITRILHGFPPSFSWASAETFFASGIFGVSCAIILYYRKDIIALVCIHAAHNILFESYRYGGEAIGMGALYVAFYFLSLICYPVFLIYKAKRTKAVH
jgi:membrane protease YdiL (CAAX protease family)